MERTKGEMMGKKRKVFPQGRGLNYQKTHFDIEALKQELVARVEMSEKFVGDTAFQVIGIIMLIRSIPVVGKILTKLIERNIRKYQRMVQKQAVKQYQERKKENKNELAGNTKQGQGST